MEQLLVWLGIFSIVTFVLSLLLLPWLVGQIPSDYFSHPRDPHPWHILLQPHTILRNALGLPIVLAGIAMLVLPGQGVLTILVGLGVMNFPGKFALERWIITRKGVLLAINWIRQKANHPPLQI